MTPVPNVNINCLLPKCITSLLVLLPKLTTKAGLMHKLTSTVAQGPELVGVVTAAFYAVGGAAMMTLAQRTPPSQIQLTAV